MTYMKSISMLKDNPTGYDAKGNEARNLIRRQGWKPEQVMIISNGKPYIANTELNPSTGKYTEPKVQHVVTTLEDLWSKDWEFVQADKYF